MKRLREILNTGRLVPWIVLFLSLCMIDRVSAAAALPRDASYVTRYRNSLSEC